MGRRLSSTERREQLLAAGARVIGKRPFGEVSVKQISQAAGVSKGLLYHYFPTKTEFIVELLEREQEELSRRLAPESGLDPIDQLRGILDRFVSYAESNECGLRAIWRKPSGGDRALQSVIDSGRRQRVETMIEALAAWRVSSAATLRTPGFETAVQGWLFSVEGTTLSWLGQRDLERSQLLELLRSSLLGALKAADQLASIDEQTN